MLVKPDWLKVPSSNSKGFADTLNVVRTAGIHTVCEEALCPNIGECWKNKTATFLIMGDTCTRRCRFCNVKTGRPNALDPDEPEKIAASVEKLGIKYAVITSVTRDDLPDGGAAHFARVIETIRLRNPDTKVEILTSDFRGNETSIQTVVAAKPDVFGHNMEIVKRLHKVVKRPPADYNVSLQFLRNIKKYAPNMITKTGMMVGVGEDKKDVLELLDDVAAAGVDIVSIGQYLAPSTSHFPIVRYVHPDEFAEYAEYGVSLGLKVVSAPLVRSSYKARETYDAVCCSK